MCAGNWLGLAAIYGLLNFGSMIVCLLVEKLFTPLLFGVVTPRHPFEALSPFYNLAERDLIIMHSNSAALPDGTLEYFGTFTLGDGWSTLAVLALVGLCYWPLPIFCTADGIWKPPETSWQSTFSSRL